MLNETISHLLNGSGRDFSKLKQVVVKHLFVEERQVCANGERHFIRIAEEKALQNDNQVNSRNEFVKSMF